MLDASEGAVLTVRPTYTRESVLTVEDAAAACDVSPNTFRQSGAPITYALGERCPRVVWGQLVDWLAKQAA